MDPGRSLTGTAADFDQARAEFEAAWRQILPTLTEANFQEWCDQRDWTAWKYTMHDAPCGCGAAPHREPEGFLVEIDKGS